jgi:hypothetical protein
MTLFANIQKGSYRRVELKYLMEAGVNMMRDVLTIQI